MTKELEMQDLELLRQIADLNISNSQMEMQIGANHQKIATLELQRKELRVLGVEKITQRNLQGEIIK